MRALRDARRASTAFAAGIIALAMAGAASAADPGVTPTSVKIGQTIPLSGPVSAYATFSRASLAYYDMINDKGRHQRSQNRVGQR